MGQGRGPILVVLRQETAGAQGADLGVSILDGVPGGSLGQVVSGMSMPTGSLDTVANWGASCSVCPLPGQAYAVPSLPWVHKVLFVCGAGVDVQPWRNG